jgi:osmoprotectant transport system permease protein
MLSYISDNASTLLRWTGWHVVLSLAPLFIGLALALPIGWLANRYRLVYAPLVAVTGLLYTIPSLALFVFMPLILGTQILSPVNIIIALSLYTLALLVRTVADGLASVPDDVTQAATAMGYKGLGRLIRVELPIAVPVIAAGVRVATVSNVSLVSVAAIIGVPQLGQLFTSGFQLQYYTPIGLGIIGCVILALAFDAIILGVTKVLTPWRRQEATP